MTKPVGKYHYEYIEARGPGHQWRVGDEDDDVVTDFATEAEAQAFVEQHNSEVDQRNAVLAARS